METLLIFLPFLVPVAVAQFAERRRWAEYATYALLVAINLGLLGIAGIALLNQAAGMLSPQLVADQPINVNWLGVALAAVLTSLTAFLPLIPAVRRWVACFLPIDPGSAVHTTALVYAIYQVGLSLGQMALIGDLDNLTEAGLTLTIWDLLLTGIPLTLLALIGVGFLVRRNGRTALVRLGLLLPTWRQLLLAAGLTALLLGFDWVVNLGWEKIDPAGYQQMERVTENLFGNLMTVGGAIALGLSAGVSEETLFRGAVQPRLGLIAATLLFTLGHVQYGLTIATAEVFVIGLALGLVRNRTSTTIAVLIHAAYNSGGVLLGLVNP
jgi:hypothetical protein